MRFFSKYLIIVVLCFSLIFLSLRALSGHSLSVWSQDRDFRCWQWKQNLNWKGTEAKYQYWKYWKPKTHNSSPFPCCPVVNISFNLVYKGCCKWHTALHVHHMCDGVHTHKEINGGQQLHPSTLCAGRVNTSISKCGGRAGFPPLFHFVTTCLFPKPKAVKDGVSGLHKSNQSCRMPHVRLSETKPSASVFEYLFQLHCSLWRTHSKRGEAVSLTVLH